MLLKRLVTFFILVFAIGACAPKLSQFPSLSNQGILPLSTNNPYLGANLFLSSEFERSSYLFNFLKGRGAPTAIEIVEEGMSRPRLLMYYAREKEVYVGTLEGSGVFKQWIIAGPYAIEREDYRQLQRTATSMIGEASFMYHGRPFQFRFRPREPLPDLKPTPPPVKTAAAKPKVKKKVTAPVITDKGTPEAKQSPAPQIPSQTGGEFKPLNTDQQAILMSQGFAERAQNGDVIHTVKKGDETLEAIAKWYTGGAGVNDLAAANGTQADVPLAPGTRITIPMKQVKEFKAMPSQ